MAFSIAAICETSQGWMVMSDGSGHVQIGHLVERRRRAVIIDAQGVENAHRRAAGADGGDIVLHVGQHFVHAGLGMGFHVADVGENVIGGELVQVSYRC